MLSFPWPLRLLFAARPNLLTRVLGVVTRALSTAAKRRAGLRAGADAETGTVRLLRERGHQIQEAQFSMGSLQSVGYRDGVYRGASDPRRPNAASRAPGPISDSR